MCIESGKFRDLGRLTRRELWKLVVRVVGFAFLAVAVLRFVVGHL